MLILWGGDRTTGLKVVHNESSKVLIYHEYSAAVGRCPVFEGRSSESAGLDSEALNVDRRHIFMNTFHRLLVNSLISGVTTNFLWFAITFWAYLETRSVLATSIIGGSFMLLSAISGLVFGTFVDRHKKTRVMLLSSSITLAAFVAASALFVRSPEGSMLVLSSVRFWSFVLLVLSGAVAGNLRMIALSTCVTLLVPEPGHAKANGLIGTVNGVAFAITSVFSGLVVGGFRLDSPRW